MRLIERMTLRSANVDGPTLQRAGIDILGAWGSMSHSGAPDFEGMSEATFDRRTITPEDAADLLATYGPDWQVVVTYWQPDPVAI